MKLFISSILLCISGLLPFSAKAFCGFYVAKADTKLFNKASKIVVARSGDKTILTMSNDYQGEAKEFAMVVPVPVKIEKDQVNVGDRTAIDRIDAYTAPRLVEYFDSDPCMQTLYEGKSMSRAAMAPSGMMAKEDGASRAKALGVTIEATYTVGEYDILILSAKQSDGLQIWLNESGYKVPKAAAKVLKSYIEQKMKFFVAKVNLKEKEKSGVQNLRPLQIAFESPKFMLPIRLGTVNAIDYQEMFVFFLSDKGRVETTNYRTVKLTSDKEIPDFVKDEFPKFYSSLFTKQTTAEGMKVLFTEYAWDMGWCDPCAAEPLTPDELKKLGVWWLASNNSSSPPPNNFNKRLGNPTGGPLPFVTRLHFRYTADKWPEDLIFQETNDRQNFQGRYILQHAFKGEMKCDEGKKYIVSRRTREETQAKTLAELTGWELASIRKKMSIDSPLPANDASDKDWYKKLWTK